MKHDLSAPSGAPLAGFDPLALPTHPADRIRALLDHLESLRDAMIEELDRLEGDADLELECEDEGAQCEDEGCDTDSEPDETGGGGYSCCNWQDEGDQTKLSALPVFTERPAAARSPHENVSGYFAVRAL
ncbi:hypothetical protein [Phenylobacterium sp.]|uniref:hypothetical protein n=1 Tax=Phenylobacterium sp. TaxID=1871053 RepID=UPI0035B229BF